MDNVLIMGIESSCDETSVSIISDGKTILSNIISSQISTHREFGGVVPEIASRQHLEAINSVMQSALDEASVTLADIDAIAVTAGPGLVGALLVGVSFAKSLTYSLGIPLIPVHHIEGHISANYVAHPDLEPPFVCLVASGGHSHIVYAKDYSEFEILGRTRDDAAGEAFDKISRVLGLGYPGGPAVEKAALTGNKTAFKFPRVHLDNRFDFSFSGVKTAVINEIHKLRQRNEELNINDVSASFQEAVTDILVENTINAAKYKNAKTICMAGGVASNTYLRNKMSASAEKCGIKLYFPPPVLCTDNAAMIACAGFFEYKKGNFADLSLNAYPSLQLGENIIM
ncbi:MAG: tRNA (adenosine(37)-N6)-threonylcarbamoyltransferase complex transferase subunit TsaD [Clostridia bacterium]|nr:tRNA (adenosine(37)-N6)-threonylcarbamoyltransferase complex transferase subunit TsaD [Clostridia bacterium]